jgi:hypothetical protein
MGHVRGLRNLLGRRTRFRYPSPPSRLRENPLRRMILASECSRQLSLISMHRSVSSFCGWTLEPKISLMDECISEVLSGLEEERMRLEIIQQMERIRQSQQDTSSTGDLGQFYVVTYTFVPTSNQSTAASTWYVSTNFCTS